MVFVDGVYYPMPLFIQLGPEPVFQKLNEFYLGDLFHLFHLGIS